MGGKKDKSEGLGRALVRQHNQTVRESKEKGRALRLQNRRVLESVTDVSDIDAVLEKAEEADRIYSVDNPAPNLHINLDAGLEASKMTPEERKQEEALHASNLRVPRRFVDCMRTCVLFKLYYSSGAFVRGLATQGWCAFDYETVQASVECYNVGGRA